MGLGGHGTDWLNNNCHEDKKTYSGEMGKTVGLSLSNQQVLSGRDAIVDTKFFAGVCISECFSFALEAFCLFW